ncbi:Peptidase [Streptococcus pneumoniae]|nr:Peptidase [Streptococcus pneumoniae]
MGLIDSMKSRKKINIFKISWDFNITLSEKLNYKRFNKNFEKILFGIFPLALILQCFIMYIYRADILTNFQNFPITLNILLFWLLVVNISATIHEFSHAIIANNYQIEIPNCGIMLLLFNLAFFVDLSGVQFLKNKKQFLKIMLAGIASNSILSLTGLLVLLFTSYKLLGLLFFIINLGMIFINSIPFFQYDSGIILRYLNSNNNNLNFQYIVQLLIAFVIIYFPLSQLLQFLTPNIIVRSIGGVVVSILLSILYMIGRTKYVLRK